MIKMISHTIKILWNLTNCCNSIYFHMHPAAGWNIPREWTLSQEVRGEISWPVDFFLCVFRRPLTCSPVLWIYFHSFKLQNYWVGGSFEIFLQIPGNLVHFCNAFSLPLLILLAASASFSSTSPVAFVRIFTTDHSARWHFVYPLCPKHLNFIVLLQLFICLSIYLFIVKER